MFLHDTSFSDELEEDELCKNYPQVTAISILNFVIPRRRPGALLARCARCALGPPPARE